MANISNIKTFVNGVLDEAKIAQDGTLFEAVINDTTGLVEKCMDQICLNQMYTDKLPELDGDEKEFGAYIEEYNFSLLTPKAAPVVEDGETYGIPYFAPALQGTFHSWKLPEYIIAGSTSYNKYKSSMKDAGAYATFVSGVLKQMVDSYNQTRYEEKKALLDWAATNVATSKTVAKPTDTESGEGFIKAVKNAVEDASFARDITVGDKTVTLGSAEGFTLYLTKEIQASLSVDTLAGAFHAENLALPCAVKVVDSADIGGAYAMLVDNRAIKLFPNRNTVGEDVNAYHDFMTMSRHVIDTPFVSKYATIVKFVEE